MSYFIDNEYTDKFNRTVKEKGRVYRVVDRKGNFMRYEIYQELFINGDKLSEFCWPFDNPDEWGVDQSDIDKALKRTSKA